jgi:N4-gp56 family major capsid protein
MPITTYGDISQRTANWAAAQMLKHAEPVLVLNKFGQTKPIPKNTASSAKFRRPIPFATATTPLIEGVTPVAHKISYEDVLVSLQQYGDLVEITDRIDDLAEDPVLSDCVTLSGEQAAATQEELLWGVLKAGTNRFFANGVQRADVNAVISINKQHAIIRSLRTNRAMPVTQILDGSSNTNTRPIEGGWIGFAHTDLEHDIRLLSGFTPVAEYGSRKPLCNEEIGSVENVRYILSPVLEPYPDAGGAKGAMKSTSGTSADVYPVVYVSRDYYGVCPLAGKGVIKPMVLNPGTPSKSDPLAQRGYVSWKTYWAGVILNEAWGAVLECAVTAL